MVALQGRRFRPWFSVGLLSLFISADLRGQGTESFEKRLQDMQARYEARLAALESEVVRLNNALVDPAAPARLRDIEKAIEGVSIPGPMAKLDATSRYSNAFNPAISLVSDLVLAASNRNDSYEVGNQFRYRSVELGITGKIDPQFSYVATFHWGEEEVELEEAFVVWDSDLFDTFSLRAGRLPVDFGRTSQLHDHELPFVDKPAAIQAFLGGKALTTGIALHHWFGLGDVPIRWSVGVGNSFDGDAHAVSGPLSYERHHHELDGPEPFGQRGLDDFILTSRVTSSIDVNSSDDLQLGFSVIHAPHVRSFEFSDPPTNSVISRHDSDRLVFGVDAFYRHHNPLGHSGWTLGGEWIWSRAEPVDTTTLPLAWLGGRSTSQGGYLMAEYSLDQHWSLGLRADHVKLRDGSLSTWDSTHLAVTYNVNEFNRVRLEVGLVDDGLIKEAYGFLMLQWTVIIGSHAHALNW